MWAESGPFIIVSTNLIYAAVCSATEALKKKKKPTTFIHVIMWRQCNLQVERHLWRIRYWHHKNFVYNILLFPCAKEQSHRYGSLPKLLNDIQLLVTNTSSLKERTSYRSADLQPRKWHLNRYVYMHTNITLLSWDNCLNWYRSTSSTSYSVWMWGW